MKTRERTEPQRNGIAGRTRLTIASYSTYSEAERVVDYLADRDFPVERVAIVARDLRLVEQVTGRMGYKEAALKGAVSGAFVGVLVGWLFGVFDWFNPLLAAAWLAFQGLWFGALIGALIGLAMQALNRGRRDFDSVSAIEAEHFDVVVDDDVATEAARLLDWFEKVSAPGADGKDGKASGEPESSGEAPKAKAEP
jgi:uncharacterized membrane protein